MASSLDTGIICTVDVPLFTLIDGQLHVALLRRDHAPYEGAMALPGAYIRTTDLDARGAAHRMLIEKTGIASPYLEQLQTFTGAKRDPRGWSISVAYYALVSSDVILSSGKEGLELRNVDDPRLLPFDHSDIVDAGVMRLRTKSMYSSLPCYLAGETFTMSQLKKIYEQVIGEQVDKITFRRKMEDLNVLEEVEGKQKGAAHRPGQLYRIKPEFEGRLSVLTRGMR
jgi:8-oxo-dGTP diphosphatase